MSCRPAHCRHAWLYDAVDCGATSLSSESPPRTAKAEALFSGAIDTIGSIIGHIEYNTDLMSHNSACRLASSCCFISRYLVQTSHYAFERPTLMQLHHVPKRRVHSSCIIIYGFPRCSVASLVALQAFKTPDMPALELKTDASTTYACVSSFVTASHT